MRHATYLCCSRHGIYYFRWPLPPTIHPHGKRSDVKVSTGLRCPKAALELSRLLYLAGQSLLRKAALLGMRYDEIRTHVQEHFRGLLQRFKKRRAETGPLDGLDLDAVLTSQMFANEGLKDWAEVHDDGADGLIRQFCAHRGIKEPDKERDRSLLLAELQKAHRSYLDAALKHNSSFDNFDLEELTNTQRSDATLSQRSRAKVEPEDKSTQALPEPALPYRQVTQKYTQEIERHAGLAEKTLFDKREALDLLGQVTGDKPVAQLTKSDARQVKDLESPI
ncbi:MAG: hypothetical protein AAGI03_11750 [Pseudomonadota bacterium]